MKLTTHFHLVPRPKNEWSYTSTPQYAFMAWCSEHGDNFTFTFTFNANGQKYICDTMFLSATQYA